MHAVVVKVNIDDEESSLQALHDNVVPAVSQTPGFVTGYWTRNGNSGMSMAVYESEDAAVAASNGVEKTVPQGVTLDEIEVREIVAKA